MIVVNAEEQILGRVGTFVAKNALLGEEVRVVNCEKAVMSGKKSHIVAAYKRKREMGIPAKGPFIPRTPEQFVKRPFRGMLPYKQPKGRDAFKRILCYRGVPKEFEGKEVKTLPHANVSKLPNPTFLTVAEICKSMGGKV